MKTTTSPKNSLKIRLFLLAIVGLLALAFVTWGLTEGAGQAPSNKVQLASVWIDTVQEGPFVRSVRGPGIFEVDEHAAEGNERFKAVIRIHGHQAKDLKVGQSATVDTQANAFQGEVSAIGDPDENGSVQVDLKLRSEIPDTGIQDGLPIDATIRLETINNAVFLGRPAYGQANTDVELFKITEDGSADRVRVKLGRMSVQHIEIVDGLEVGDRVILSDITLWDNYDRIYLQ